MITTLEEFKIYNKINEFYGGASKGQILFVLQDIERLIKKLSKYGLSSTEIEDKIFNIIKDKTKSNKIPDVLK